MKRITITVLGSLLMFLLTAVSAKAQLCSYVLTGQVLNANTNAPVTGQTVSVLLDSTIWGSNNVITATTTPNGSYHFTIPVSCNTPANFVVSLSACGQYYSVPVNATPNAQTYSNTFSICATTPIFCLVQAQVDTISGNQVSFNQVGTSNAGASIQSVVWDMGDGYVTNNYPNGGTHTYANAGTYVACVTVTWNNGCQSTDCDTITVGNSAVCPYIISGTATNSQNGQPLSSLVISVSTPMGVYNTQTNPNGFYIVTVLGPCNSPFTAYATANGCGMTFTAGISLTPNTSNYTHNFSICGNTNPVDSCTANANVTYAGNNAIDFSWTGSSSSGASVQSVVWHFGNNNYSYNFPNGGSYTYFFADTYNVCVVVTYTSGCVVTSCETVIIPPSPLCSYTVTGMVTNAQTNAPAPNQMITITNSLGNSFTALSDPNGYYALTLTGPCNSIFGAEISTIGCGQTYSDSLYFNPNTLTQTFNLIICQNNTTPDSCFAYPQLVLTGNNTVNFSFNGSSNNGGSVQSVVWDLGDGFITNNYPNGGQHTYAQPGTYTACVEVTYSTGCIATGCTAITIAPLLQGSICGCVTYEGNTPGQILNAGCGEAYLIQLDPMNNGAAVIDTTIITPNGYCFNNINMNSNVNYTVLAVPCAALMVSDGVLPTYLGNELFWQNADTTVFNNYSANCINLLNGQSSQGPGQISGTIIWSEDKAIGDPVVGVTVFLLDMNADPIAAVTTDSEGFYSFADLPYGTYRIYPEVPGLLTYPILVTISPETETYDYANFNLGFGIFMGMQDEQFSVDGLYPNPTVESITLSINSAEAGNGNISITDISGKTVMQVPALISSGQQQLTLNVNQLNAGIYTLTLRVNGKQLYSKFIKQ